VLKDKVVVSVDFMGIKPGHLVRFVRNDLDARKGDVCLVVDRLIIDRSLGEGDHEICDPILVVLNRGRRAYVPVDAVRQVEEDI
jgi:hypothetical protein